ncbi:DNA packaging protein [Cyanophage S-TIM5]|uniref:DNA packaging protein n=1 Tax=Cyanophage S-TIM5 TaxID=1137745 RepID=H6WG47_9CAUD|nr:DNA packaging protein [Cyanophage S-TIM5]AEZ65593.1 DNA packaging protein [Cyanophage S-TIM5]UYE96757.1 DNA packaging [Cyanophage S-TIM66]UYE96970.1 DNA packaging [Cyanophage S-TIM61]
MIGKLDPEEVVMDELSSKRKAAAVMKTVHEHLANTIAELGWDCYDNVAVEIGGTSVYEIEGAGTKWAPLKGTRKYNKDAFIIIKNLDRNPTVPSQPNPELKAHHLKTEKEINAELKKRDDKLNYDTYSK